MKRTLFSSVLPRLAAAMQPDHIVPAWRMLRCWVWIVSAALFVCAAGARAQNTFGSIAVGSSSVAQSVTVTSPGGGTVKTVLVVNVGASSGDFAAASGTSTCANATLAAKATCTQSVTFTPSAPGLRLGAVVVLDNSGSVIGTGYISGVGTGGLGVLSSGNLLPYAGQDGLYSALNDGLPATSAELYLPAGITMDGAGNLYIADSLHHRIRMVCGVKNTATISGVTCSGVGVITTITGNGNSSFSGDGGLASAATLNQPNSVAVDGAGNLYIADTGNNRVRMISAATGVITTVAGDGSAGDSANNNVGDGGAATAAHLNQPWGVTVDGAGNFYIADTSNHRIRAVSAATGIITTIAGTGKTASDGDGDYNGDGITAIAADLNYPHGVAFDAAGNMYIPDTQNHRVREVAAVSGAITSASTITTFAGTGTAGFSGDGGVANQAELYLPSAVALDPAGNVFIADAQNNAIRKVIASSAARYDAGAIYTVMQSGYGEYFFDGVSSEINLYGPKGLFLDSSGNLFIADYFNMVVRELQSNYIHLDFTDVPTRQGAVSYTRRQTVENEGNDALDLMTLTANTNSEIQYLAGNACTAGDTLSVDTDCVIDISFAPATTPSLTANQTETSSVTVAEDTQPTIPAPNSPINIELVGIAEPVNGTTTTITSMLNPSTFGQSVTFTVNVSTGSGTGNLTGTVAIADTYKGTTTNLAMSLALTLNSAGNVGSATFAISTLGVGLHTIVASYSGDSAHFTSTSTDNGVSALIQTVQETTGTTLTSSVNPSLVGQSVTFTATVAASAGGVVPAGTVQFMDGATLLGSPVSLTTSGSAGVATYTTTTLTNGVHSITAVYSGDSSSQIQGNTSNTVNQDVQVASTLVLTSSLNPSFYGNPVTFTAIITSAATSPATGTVTFLDNGQQIGTGTLAGNPSVASFTTSTLVVGTHPITATYVGDNYNSASASAAPWKQVVNLGQTATSVIAAPNPGIAGAPETITATVTVTAGSLTPAGSVTFTAGATTLGVANLDASGKAVITPSLSPGVYQIVATYAGNSQASGSTSAAFPLTVVQATTQTALSVNPNPGLVTFPITFTATVTGNGGTSTGVVNFTANGSSIGAAQLNGSGVAAITVSTLPVGAYAVVASYAGDINDAASASAPVPLNVILATTSVAINVSPNPAIVTQAVTFTAKVTGNGGTPTGAVSFTANGNVIGTATLNAGTATFTDSALPVGAYTVTAVYAGDSADAASTSPSTTETINLIPTQTDLGASTTSGTNPEVILVATVLNGATGPMPTGTVTFLSGTTVLGSATLNSSGVATLVPNLTNGVNYSITASYGGDATHGASSSTIVTVSGTATGFNLTATPAAISMKTSQNATITVNLTSISGFSDTIAFGCGSLPTGVTCHFSPASVSLTANGTASAQLTIDTNNPLSGGSSAMNRTGTGGRAYLAGLFLPIGVFFGWFFWRLRRRATGLLTMVLVLVLSAAALLATGCGGISMSSVAPGTYTIQITATGVNSDVIHYQNETLTITQ